MGCPGEESERLGQLRPAFHLHAPGVAWASQAGPWVEPRSKDRKDEGGQGSDPPDPGREAGWWGQA